jgi:hypothetical protein
MVTLVVAPSANVAAGKLTTLSGAALDQDLSVAASGSVVAFSVADVSPPFTPTGSNVTPGPEVITGSDDQFIVAPATNFDASGSLASLTGCFVSTNRTLTGLLSNISYRAALLTQGSPVINLTSAPSAFAPGDWSVADTATGGIVRVTIGSLPFNGGSAITNIHIFVNGSGTPVVTGLTGVGSFDVSGLVNDASHSFTIAAVNAIGQGPLSAAKTATPTIFNPASVSFANEKAKVFASFAASPDGAWAGFTSESGFASVTTVTHPDQVKAAWDAWAAGSPATTKHKVYMAWNGPLTPSAARWFGPTAAKLSAYADATKLNGYAIPPGGFWIESAPGFDPIWDKTLNITGASRLHIGKMRIGGRRGATPSDTSFSLSLDRTSTYPLLGCVYADDLNVGLMDNDPSSSQADRGSGIKFFNGHSLSAKKIRAAGLVYGTYFVGEHCKIDQYDLQQFLGDMFYSRAFGNSFIGRVANLYIGTLLARDMTYLATATHCDLAQLGTGADVHAGYRAVYENFIFHLKAEPSTGGSQAAYNDDALAAVKMECAIKNFVGAINATWFFNMWDPSQAGINVIENFMGFRSGAPSNGGNGLPQDSMPTINIPHGIANGGARKVSNGVIGDIIGGGKASATIQNVTYVSPKKGVAQGNTGQTSSSPIRMENFVKGAVSRDAQDWMTYTIPNEASTDFATAFYALADFFDPDAGWGSPNTPPSPETWAGAPARP